MYAETEQPVALVDRTVTDEEAKQLVTLTPAGEQELAVYQRALSLIDELHCAPKILATLPPNVRAQLRVEAARLAACVQELDMLEARA